MVDDALAVLTPDEMAQADRLAAETVPSYALMENAGRAVARAALRDFPPSRTLVLCGPGNNGGDGYVAARLLAQRGWPVRLAALAPPRPGSDAARAAALWRGPVHKFANAQVARAGLVIDAVFGAGLSRAVDGVAAEVLEQASRHPLLAVDIPSGVDGATGAILGMAPQAVRTVSFFRRKPGHLLLPGRDRLGALEIADIGLPDSVLAQVAPRTWHNRPGLWRLRTLEATDHKYSRGVVSVCGGAMSGAARLAAAGARGAGAGLVRIASETHADLYRMGPPGLIVDEQPLARLLDDSRRQVWVCGPGLDPDEVRGALPALLAAGRQVVADAGALTEAAGSAERLRGVAVITPHAGEFARVFGDLGADRLAAARAAARTIDSVVVLKGADSIVAAPDGRAAIADNAPPWLATAGAGDVLSGVIGAMLAAGMAAFEAASASVWLHGEAARLAGEGLLAEDLAGMLARAVLASHNAVG